jgi:hypothetical protein
MLSSNGEVKRRVAAGDFAFGLADTDDASVAMKEGKAVGMVYADERLAAPVLVLEPLQQLVSRRVVAQEAHCGLGQRPLEVDVADLRPAGAMLLAGGFLEHLTRWAKEANSCTRGNRSTSWISCRSVIARILPTPGIKHSRSNVSWS